MNVRVCTTRDLGGGKAAGLEGATTVDAITTRKMATKDDKLGGLATKDEGHDYQASEDDKQGGLATKDEEVKGHDYQASEDDKQGSLATKGAKTIEAITARVQRTTLQEGRRNKKNACMQHELC